MKYILFVILSGTYLSIKAQSPKTNYIKIYRELAVSPINDSSLVDSLFKLAFIINNYQSDSSETIADDFLKLALKNDKNNYLLGKAHVYKGIVARDNENHIDAITHLNLAIKYLNKNIPSIVLCYTYQTLSATYSELNNPELESKTLLLGLEMAMVLQNNVLLGNSYNALGIKYNKEKKYHKAKAMFRLSINIRKITNDKIGLMRGYLNMSISCRNISEFDSAMYYINSALTLADTEGNLYYKSYAYSDKGATYLLMNSIDSAITYLKLSEKIRITIDEKRELASTYFYLADCYAKKQQFHLALGYYHKAKNLYNITYNLKELASTYEQMGEFFFKIKSFDSAYVYQRKYQRNKDSLTLINNNRSTDALIASFQFEEKEKAIQLLNSQKQTQELKINNQQQLLGIAFVCLLFMIILIVFVIYTRKQKIKKVLLETSLKEESLKRFESEKLQKEKERISRDLHDNVGGQLSYILYSLDGIDNTDTTKRNEIKTNINKSVRSVIQNLRETIWAINDESIKINDLSDKLKVYSRSMFKNSNTKIIFSENIQTEILLNSLVGLNLYRICQEIINNAFKYSNATELKISIISQEKISITIADNGKGFDLNEQTEGFGLRNIYDRAQEIEASVTLNASKNQGVTYTIVV